MASLSQPTAARDRPGESAEALPGAPRAAARHGLARRATIGLYFVALALSSQFEVVAGGRTASQSAFIANLSFRSRPPPDPVLDQAPGYIQQALGHLGVGLLASAHSPWWNPYVGLGAPLAGDFQSAVFYPVALIASWLHLGSGGIDVTALSDVVIAGASAYWLAQVIGLRARGALATGTAFALAGSFIWFGTLFGNVMAWAPLSLGLTLRILGPGDRRRRDVLLLGAVTAVQILGGFPEALGLQGLLLTLPLGAAALLRRREHRGCAVLRLAEGFALGAAASAFLWMPFVTALSSEALWNSTQTGLRHLPAWADLTLVVPFAFGHWFATKSLSSLAWYQLGGYVGGVAAWLGLAGLIGTWRRRPWITVPLALSILIAMAWVNGMAPFSWIGRLPGLDRVPFGRLAVAELELAVALLAGIAVDLPASWRACAAASVISGGALWLLIGEAPPGIDPHDLMFAVVCLAAVAVGFPVLGALARAAPRASARRLLSLGASGLAVGMIAFELVTLSNLDWRGLPPRRSAWEKATPAWVDYVRAHLGGGRLYSANGLMQPGYSGDFKIEDLSFEDAVVPRKTVEFVQRNVDPQNPNPLAFIGYPMGDTVPARIGALELAGVTLLALPDPGCQPGCAHLALRFEDAAAGVGIFAVPDAQPFLWLPSRVVIRRGLPTHPLSAAAVRAGSSAARLSGSAMAGSGPGGSAVAQLVRGGSSRLVATVQTSRRRLLVVRQTVFPGWRAAVNGRTVKEVSVDGVFQGLTVPKGRSRVVLSYRPPGLRWAEALSLAAVAWALLSSAFLVRRRRSAMRSPAGHHVVRAPEGIDVTQSY